MKKFGAMFILVLLTAVISVEAEASWTAEVFGGTAYNFNTPLTIHQTGEENISFNAKYDTKPLNGSPYYAFRFGRWKESRAWELEFIHHKLYLRNSPPEIQLFEISHGYNFIYGNRAWKHKGFIFRVGAGLVMTHPETIVRGKELPWNRGLLRDGNYLSGVSAQVAAGKRFYLWKSLFFTLEAKLTASYANIPIECGDANVPNVALHGLFGFGYDF